MAAFAGLDLDPWQQYVLEESLGERDDGKWAAFEVGLVVPRQNGKGSVLEARELAGLFLFDEELILHSAHEYKTSADAYRRLSGLINRTPDLKSKMGRELGGYGTEMIELKSGARIQFIARTSGSGRGFYPDLVVLDEAYNLTQPSRNALLYAMSARPNPQLWYTSSPVNSDEHLHGHILAGVRKRGIQGDDPRLCYLEWSADDEADSDDESAWVASNPSMGFRLSMEAVRNERSASGPQGVRAFRVERMGIGAWPEDETDAWRVLTEDQWSGLQDEASRRSGVVAFGVDVAPDRSMASIGVAGRRADGLEHVEVVEHRPGTDWVVERLAEIVKDKKPCAVALDGASAAASLAPALAEAKVDVLMASTREVGQACGGFYDAAVDGRMRVFPRLALSAAVRVARKRDIGADGAWKWWRKGVADLSPLYAVTLARYGHAVHGPNQGSVYEERGMVVI